MNREMSSLKRGKIERGYRWMMTVKERSMKPKLMMTMAFQRGKRQLRTAVRSGNTQPEKLLRQAEGRLRHGKKRNVEMR